MKYLGIDYGKKKIGIAVSDDSGKVAFAKVIIPNEGEKAVKKILEIIKNEKITAVVMGESKDFSGVENPVMKKIRRFGGVIQKETGLPVDFQPEFLSSMESSRILNDEEDDARAAAIVLQSFLDKINSPS